MSRLACQLFSGTFDPWGSGHSVKKSLVSHRRRGKAVDRHLSKVTGQPLRTSCCPSLMSFYLVLHTYMTIQNTATHADRSDVPIALIDLIHQFYTNQLRLLESAEQANCDMTSSLPGWLKTAMSKEKKRRANSDPAPGLSEGAEQIQLSLYAPSMDVRAAQDVTRLMDVLSDEPSVCVASMGSMHLVFKDFRSEQRERWEEVAREHFQKVNRQWPYWLHFLKPTFKNYANLTALLCEPLAYRQVAGKSHAIMNRDDLYAELRRLVLASLNLQEIWGVSMERRWHHSRQVVEMLRQCVMRG